EKHFMSIPPPWHRPAGYHHFIHSLWPPPIAQYSLSPFTGVFIQFRTQPSLKGQILLKLIQTADQAEAIANPVPFNQYRLGATNRSERAQILAQRSIIFQTCHISNFDQ